ncbi:hypothetical protein L3X38_041436 [Prunus dulcis]|uniref:Ubiquitin-like protease family profile domain-containing protein n=1 Tax=Prunus dulcis TaxID=3755 RepID=A0AAD4YKX1_PRUDU|nr:hypothetical protein L3X38_041436 [Prunus dulcis]
MLLGDDIGESTEGTKVEFTLGDIDLDQPTAVLSQLNVWLNDKETTGLQMLDPIKAIPHDDLVKLLKLCWEWRHNPNLVMQFGNVEAEIEFFASLVKADGWLKGDVSLIDYAFVLMYIDYEIDKKNMLQHIDLGLYLIRKRQQELEEVEISDWTTTDVFFMVPACGMDWQNVYKVYAPCMLTKYKHWVTVMIDMVLCEIKVYDSKVSLIPDEILKEELAPLSITIPNLLNTIDFYEEGVYANNCSRDWWCPWPIELVDVPQQSNQ